MAAKDDTVNVPVMPTAKVALGPGLAGLDDPVKAVAGSLLLPDAGAIMAGRATRLPSSNIPPAPPAIPRE